MIDLRGKKWGYLDLVNSVNENEGKNWWNFVTSVLIEILIF